MEGLKKRRLGSQGLEVSEMGLGCMGMTGLYGAPDADEAERTIHLALDLGVTFLDTAESYGPFANERLLGRALEGRRDAAIVATKFAWEFSDSGQRRRLDGRPENVRRACDASLGRLRVDHIDLFYQHRVDPMVPIEETVGAMADLVKAGKVRFLGLSEASLTTIRRAHAVHPISALQTEYSLWERGPEEELLPSLRELGIGFVAYSPLGRGFLTGGVKPAEEYPEDDYRRQDPRLQGEHFEHNRKIVEAVRDLAAKKNATAGQLALAWLLHRGTDVVPIPGTKRRSYLEENVAATNLALDAGDLALLDEAAPRGGTAGPRYNERHMSAIDR